MVSRSYTPPTCTLKVTAGGFPILAWMGIPRRQRFHLSFDDPRIPEAEHITLKGDRTQLDTLHKVVTTYVQEFLNNSPNLPLDMESTGVENDGTVVSQYKHTKIPENHVHLRDTQLSMESSEFLIDDQEIYLQPQGLLSHDLFLGTLANNESGKFITLSMLQIFDLAIALDECIADLQTLPQFQSDGEVKTIPEWLRSVALILITAGLTAVAVKLYNRYAISQKQQDETIATSDPTNNNNQPIPGQASPSPTPLPTPTVTPSPLLPTPPASLPTPTISPLPIAKPSPIQTPPPLFPAPNPAPPNQTNLPAPLTDFPVFPQPQNQGAATSAPPLTDFPAFPQPQNQGAAATSAPPVINNPPLPQPPNGAVVVIPPPPSLIPPPLPPPALPNYGVLVQPIPPVQPAPNLQIQPPSFLNQNPPPTSGGGVRPYVDVSRIPVNVPGAIDLPPLEDVQPTVANEEDTQNLTNGKDPVALRDRKAALDPSQIRNGRKLKSTLFDQIPQVVEVREYFEDSWKPPKDLDQNLQYSLLLNGDGSVSRVTPIGLASIEFYGNTNMPEEDKVFVSNIEGGKTATIRLVLRPDGQVQTFLESLN